MKASSFAEFSLNGTHNLDKKILNILFVAKRFALIKTMGCAAEEASTLIFLVDLVDKDFFKVTRRVE
jgi:hypothetical protein